MKAHDRKDFYENVFNSIIHYIQNLTMAQLSVIRRKDLKNQQWKKKKKNQQETFRASSSEAVYLQPSWAC